MRDRSQVLDQFLPGHSHAGIGDGDGLGRVVRGDGDFGLDVGTNDFLPRALKKAELLTGIRCVGDQLADIDLLIGLE